ncbi:MAG: hypothetical protein AAGF11_46355 [Myxococcota bacterium]
MSPTVEPPPSAPVEAAAEPGLTPAEEAPVATTPVEPVTSGESSESEASGSSEVSPAGSMPVVTMGNMAGSELPASRPGVFPSAAARRKNRAKKGGRRLSSRGGGPDAGDWGFIFNGYLRAPMRLGLGQRAEPAEGQSRTTIHNPLVPDDQYLSYQYTLHNPRDWSELYLGYGNSVVAGMVSIQGFNFTDAAWKENDAQFGIAQAFVALTPKLPSDRLRLTWKVGSFDNRYGQAGIYDAGELDTYAFGRTHGMGEAGQLDILIKDFTITLEHGLGATRPDPNAYNLARFTFFHHAHLGLAYQRKVQLGGHFLQAIAREEDRLGADINTDFEANPPDGTMTVAGPDLRINWGRLGYYYGAFSYIRARHARTVGPSIEVIHSRGAGQFNFGIIDNYLEGRGENDSGGNGEIYTVMAQVQNSVQRIRKGDAFWGEGMDFGIKLYGMLNMIASDNPSVDGIRKLKYGADARFDILRWLAVATRYDRVQPNSRIPEQSFSVISPRLIFRTNWITREEIALQYSRYVYNERCEPMEVPDFLGYPQDCVQPPAAPVPPEGFGSIPINLDDDTRAAPMAPADLHVVSLRATFWW